MAPILQSLGIDQMSIPVRIALATAIWDSIAVKPHLPLLTESQKLELQKRLTDHLENPQDISPWEQIKAEALARFQR
jgi:putative addiction module component (TIGR02574 family)